VVFGVVLSRSGKFLMNYKLFAAFDKKYGEFHKDPCDDPAVEIEVPWVQYLVSLGCIRGKRWEIEQRKGDDRFICPHSFSNPDHVAHTDATVIVCPDSYHRAYSERLILIPVELAFRVLSLGFLP
jgi:hypothetical protein